VRQPTRLGQGRAMSDMEDGLPLATWRGDLEALREAKMERQGPGERASIPVRLEARRQQE
jgi:hypothetical protein